jgi:cytoskeletal protein CcmA (bactofilin family)
MLKTNPNEGVSGPGTVVGVNVALSGTLKDQNDIAVYGMVDGEVVSDKSVTVGQTAQVKGPVRGRVVTVAGVVRGSIDASEKLELLETGKVFGSIAAKDLVVKSGAIIAGKVTMAAEEGDEAAILDKAEDTQDEEGESAPAETETEPVESGSETDLTPDEE